MTRSGTKKKQWDQPMAKPRHKNFDKIVEDLLIDVPVKTISHSRKASARTIRDIRKKAIKLVKVKIPLPGEGQLNFFDVWKNLR